MIKKACEMSDDTGEAARIAKRRERAEARLATKPARDEARRKKKSINPKDAMDSLNDHSAPFPPPQPSADFGKSQDSVHFTASRRTTPFAPQDVLDSMNSLDDFSNSFGQPAARPAVAPEAELKKKTPDVEKAPTTEKKQRRTHKPKSDAAAAIPKTPPQQPPLPKIPRGDAPMAGRTPLIKKLEMPEDEEKDVAWADRVRKSRSSKEQGHTR